MRGFSKDFHLWFKILDRLPVQVVRTIEQLVSDPKNIQTVGLWISALAAGVVAVFYAKLFRFAEQSFLRILTDAGPFTLTISPLCFLLAWYIVRKYAPEAAGSGIPQIMAANEIDYEGENRKTVDRLLSLRTAGIKIVSSILCVVGGGAIGREGPTLQVSSSIFHFLGLQVRRFIPNVSEHIWVVAGAAAGLASAFNTPLGGIVYAIEEFGSVHFHKVRTSLLSGVIVSGLVAQWLLGSYLLLGFPPLAGVGFSVLPVSIVNGLITGIFGACFGRLLIYVWKKRLAITNVKRLALLTFSSGVVVASLSLLEPETPGSGIHVITGLLFQNEHSSLTLIAARWIGTVCSYLSGAAGGIFSPSLAIGATMGNYLTQFFGSDIPNLMTLLGMIGFLTGVTRTPFTSFILVLEMTDRHSAIFPMMVTALSAQWISRAVSNRSFYEQVKDYYVKR